MSMFKKSKDKLVKKIKFQTAEFIALKEIIKNPDQLQEPVNKNYTYEDFIRDNKEELSEEEFVRVCLSNQTKIFYIYLAATIFFATCFIVSLHPITIFLLLIFLIKSIIYKHKIAQLQSKRLFTLKEFVVSAFSKKK